MPRPDSAFAIIQRGRRVLLVKSRPKKRWQLPGGALKRGEAPWTGAQREVHEETGLRARLIRLTGVYRRSDGSLAFVFSARVDGNAPLAGPRNEILKQGWMRAGTAVRLLSKRAARRLLDAIKPASTQRLPFILRLTAG